MFYIYTYRTYYYFCGVFFFFAPRQRCSADLSISEHAHDMQCRGELHSHVLTYMHTDYPYKAVRTPFIWILEFINREKKWGKVCSMFCCAEAEAPLLIISWMSRTVSIWYSIPRIVDGNISLRHTALRIDATRNIQCIYIFLNVKYWRIAEQLYSFHLNRCACIYFLCFK